MFIPDVYGVALLLMILSMFCWGSWANTEKLCKNWRFELYFWDYVWGIVLTTLVMGLTFGCVDLKSPASFFNNLRAADGPHWLFAILSGGVFTMASLVLVGAIAIAGMAVAFPIGVGVGLVLGTVLNYVITPRGNPWLLFGGLASVCVAVVLDAVAYRKVSTDLKVSTKGIILSLLVGFGGLFYPLLTKATVGENHLVPYTVAFVFALGVVLFTIPLNYAFMSRPIVGSPITMGDYFQGTRSVHLWGILGGVIWGIGTVCNLVASHAKMVGPATSYAIGQGATMVSAIWGVFVWKEFRGAGPKVKRLLALMFFFFLLGLTAVALAPLISW